MVINIKIVKFGKQKLTKTCFQHMFWMKFLASTWKIHVSSQGTDREYNIPIYDYISILQRPDMIHIFIHHRNNMLLNLIFTYSGCTGLLCTDWCLILCSLPWIIMLQLKFITHSLWCSGMLGEKSYILWKQERQNQGSRLTVRVSISIS